MLINQLRTVDDLAEGEQATPEPGIDYELRTMRNETIDAGLVEHVFRHGDQLLARTTSGESYLVTGHGSPVLVPRRR